MEKDTKDIIDLGKIIRILLDKKKTFFKLWIIVFILSCFWILPKPRYYDATVVLAPETGGADISGGLSSIASNFGVNLNSPTSDAIYPMLYPDLMSSNDFIVSLFDIPVKSLDGKISCDLYTYLDKKQKIAFYNIPKVRIKRWLRNNFGKEDPALALTGKGGKMKKVNPFLLTRHQAGLVALLKDNISCSVDKKTEVVTINVRMQDALIAASLADSVSSRLQRFITEYRTKKARVDLEYYSNLASKAKADYEKVRRLYGSYSDSNTDITLPSLQAKIEDIENDMQLKYNSYTAMNTQMEAAKAKVQERTPAFTVLQTPTVPVKPSGPKRMIFVAGMLILSTIIMSLWLARKELNVFYDSKPH